MFVEQIVELHDISGQQARAGIEQDVIADICDPAERRERRDVAGLELEKRAGVEAGSGGAVVQGEAGRLPVGHVSELHGEVSIPVGGNSPLS